MKITNRQVRDFIFGVENNGLSRKRLPVKMGYAISRNISAMNGIVATYEESREKLIDQYAEKNKDGTPKIQEVNGTNIAVIPEDKKKEFSDAIEELLDIENEIDLYTINMDEVEKCDTDKYDSLTTADLLTLDIMIN